MNLKSKQMCLITKNCDEFLQKNWISVHLDQWSVNIGQPWPTVFSTRVDLLFNELILASFNSIFISTASEGRKLGACHVFRLFVLFGNAIQEHKNIGTSMWYLWTWSLSVVPWRVTPSFRPADPVHTESWVSGTCSTRPAEKCRPLDHVKRIVYPIHQMIIWSNLIWFKSETRPSSLRNLELASIFDLRLQNLFEVILFQRGTCVLVSRHLRMHTF